MTLRTLCFKDLLPAGIGICWIAGTGQRRTAKPPGTGNHHAGDETARKNKESHLPIPTFLHI
jgi:hypothetical protein